MDGQREDKRAGPQSCGRIEVPTAQELAALNAMHDIKKQVRILKARLSEIVSGAVPGKPGEEEALHEELVTLKKQWESWEQNRRKAAHDRMVLLGHEGPLKKP